MPDIVSRTDLENAKMDLQTIDEVANGSETLGGDGLVHPRTGSDIKTLAKVIADLASQDVGAAAAADIVARLASRVLYDDAASFEAGTSDGDYGYIGEQLTKNVSGTATTVSNDALQDVINNKAEKTDVATDRDYEGGFAVQDQDGNLAFRVLQSMVTEFEKVGLLSGSSLQELSDGGFSVSDAAGDALMLLSSLGRLSVSSLAIPGVTMEPSATYALQMRDEDGNQVFAYSADGTESTDSEQPTEAIDHTVDYFYVEGRGDATTQAYVSWVTNSLEGDTLLLSLNDSPEVRAYRSVRSRAFRDVSGKYIHTALASDLSPGAVYKVRAYKAEKSDTFRMPPRVGVKLMVFSDYQQYDFTESSLLGRFGSLCDTKGVDFLVLNGDYVNDDGVFSTTNGTRWFNFLHSITKFFRTADSHMVPMAAVTGNHEGRNAADTSNALHGGDGTMGYMADIFSWSYDSEEEDRDRDSASILTFGQELLLISLETDHTQPLPDQLPWFQGQLAKAPNYRSTVVFGHVGAFLGGDLYELDDFPNQARALRNDFWPAMQTQAGYIRAYFAGHDHFLGVTARLKMDPDDTLTDAQNDVRWTTASDGVRQLGLGPAGGIRNALNAADMAEVSSIDGSPKFVAALGYNAGLDETMVHGTGITNASVNIWNVWTAEFTASQFRAEALDRDGQSLYLLTESI